MENQIKQILEKLNDNGYEAYLVGGFVRDSLLGIKTFDVDICTNALPKDIHRLFNTTKNNYGSINMVIDNYSVDITTFRKDFDYVNRHPSKVEYINSLEEDLKRRDFTMNAICMDAEGKVIDLLGGVNDLSARRIKAIGNTVTKLIEDPLRILRAIRFATVLDFDLEDELLLGIKNNANLVKNLSGQRIKDELERILLSKNFKKGLHLLKETKLDELIGIYYDEINYVDDLIGMWAQIKVLNLPFTNIEKSNIIKIAEVINYGLIDEEMLYKYGLYICTTAGKILNINPVKINKLAKKLPIKSREDIDITPHELEVIVGSGKSIGDTYEKLTKLILQGKLKNKNKEIKKYLGK